MTTYYLYNGSLLLRVLNENQYLLPKEVDISSFDYLELSFVSLQGESCKVVEFQQKDIPIIDCCQWILLRQVFGKIPITDFQNVGKAAELVDWYHQSAYCGKCGSKQTLKSPISRYCSVCDVETWPQLSPAIIVLIYRGDEVLLIHNRNFRGNFYGLVSGFVELGESFEECLKREVMEETHLKVKNIQYFGSQAWPYPRNIMVGYMAEYESGDLQLQDEEISSGNWYKYDKLPLIPTKPSISRQLIDVWLKSFV